MSVEIELSGVNNNRERIDYLELILEGDAKRLEIIDLHRHKNLAHALITFAAAFGATLKFLPEANPYLITISLFCLASCFFLRDFQLHRYQHGWVGTIAEHLQTLASVINNPEGKVNFCLYYRTKERESLRWKEWTSFNRLAYYLLFLGAIGAGVILANGWIKTT